MVNDMREILFRAKRISDGEWIEGNYVCDTDLNLHYIVGWTYDVSDCELEREYFKEKVIPETICQFTGLTDKNDNEIWENDIVKKVDTNALGWHRERMCSVSFDKWGYWLLTTEYGDGYWLGEFQSEQLEVVSTIFDNPELLKGGLI